MDSIKMRVRVRRAELAEPVAVWLLRLLPLGALLLGWWLATRNGTVSDVILPPLGSTFSEVWRLLQTATTGKNALVTCLEVAISAAIAVPVGFIIAAWGARSAYRQRFIEPLLYAAYIIPLVLFYPLLVLWAGVGIWSKIIFAALLGVIPMAITSLDGLTTVSPLTIRMARSFGATSRDLDWRVKFPAALPMILAATRVAIATTIVGTLVAELFASTQGLGFELTSAADLYDTSQSYALAIVLVVGVVIVNLAVTRLLSQKGSKSGGRPSRV